MRDLRTDTSENSAATSRPLSAIRTTMTRSSKIGPDTRYSAVVLVVRSRIRAGTPSAILPAGTSLVTTAPAPV